MTEHWVVMRVAKAIAPAEWMPGWRDSHVGRWRREMAIYAASAAIAEYRKIMEKAT